MSAGFQPVALAAPSRSVLLVLRPVDAQLLARAAAGVEIPGHEVTRLMALGELLRDAAAQAVQS